MAATALRPAPAPRRVVAAYVPGVATLELALIARDGQYRVGPVYVANAADADRRRRAVAQSLRSDALRGVPRAVAQVGRLTATLARHRAAQALCPWCGCRSVGAAGAVTVDGRTLHAHCAGQLDAAMEG